MNTVERLFSDYLYYRTKTGWFQTRPSYYKAPKLTKERVKILEDLMRWCVQHRVHPRWFLYAQFDRRHWRHVPAWSSLVPKPGAASDTAAQYAKELRSAPYLTELMDQATQANWMSRFHAYKELSATVENLKRRYWQQGHSERCLSEVETATMGYHPKSKVCVSCPLREQCLRKTQSMTNYDLVALRNGAISLDHARRLAALNA